MSTEPKAFELVPEWCMKCGSSIFMLSRAMRTEWRIAGIIARHYAPVAEAHAKEVERLQSIIDTHDMCHNLHGKVDARAFTDGCAAEQRKLYGCAPDADRVKQLEEALQDWYDNHHPCNCEDCKGLRLRTLAALENK